MDISHEIRLTITIRTSAKMIATNAKIVMNLLTRLGGKSRKKAEEDYEAYINDPTKTEEQIQNAKDTLLLVKGSYDFYAKTVATKEAEFEQRKQDVAKLEDAVANKNELIAGSEKLQKAKEDLERGREKYEIAKQDAEAELEDAKVKLAEAEREINSMEIPVWYVLNRDAVESYIAGNVSTNGNVVLNALFDKLFVNCSF